MTPRQYGALQHWLEYIKFMGARRVVDPTPSGVGVAQQRAGLPAPVPRSI